MPLDPEVLASIQAAPQSPQPLPSLDPDVLRAVESPQPLPSLDPDVLRAVDKNDEYVKQRRDYLRDKYVWGMVAPLTGTRKTYTKQAIKEVNDPYERRWLVDEVARVAKMQEWAQRKEYSESGYLGRVWKNAQKVGGSFAEAGTGMVGAATDLRDWLQGRGRSEEEVKFYRALEAAKGGENPYIGEDAPLTLKAAAGASGMAPDLAAGLLANAAGGPAGVAAYWTARQQPERREDYLEMGISPEWSALAGTLTAGAEAGIELINIDPTGLTNKVAAPVKGVLRRGITRAAEKVGKKSLKRALLHPVTTRAISAGVDAVKKTGLESLEEGLQGAVQEGGKYIAAKVSDQTEDRPATGILKEGYLQARQALPGLAVLGGVGGMARAGEAASRFKRFAEGTKSARVNKEIVEFSNSGKTPSRAKWREWGLPADEGKSRAERRRAVKEVSKSIGDMEQLRSVITGVAPSASQWKSLGLPVEAGKTEESRIQFLREKFAPPEIQAMGSAASPAAAEPGEPVPAAAAGDLSAEAAPEQPAGEAAQAARGMRPAIHDFPVEMEGTGERVSARDAVRQIEQIWGEPIRSGRLGIGGGVRGIYKPGSWSSRLAKGEESSVAVAAHEAIGHHLDNSTDVLKKAPKEARAELGQFDYDQTKRRESEGFAEFLRAYLTGATEANRAGVDTAALASKFTAYFSDWLDANPEYKQKIEATRGPINALKQAGAVGRVKGQVSKTGVDVESKPPLVERLNEWKEFLYTRLKEEGRPIKRFTEAAEKRGYKPGKGETTPFEDYNALRQIGPHFAAVALERGVFSLTGNMQKIGPSLTEALAEIRDGDDYENFVAWAYARHALESWEKGKNPGVTAEDAREAKRRLENPRYERAGDALTEFNNALIVVLAEVGVLDGDTAKKILDEYEYYIPLERAKEGSLGGGGRRMVDLSAAIKGRRGSGLQIIDPVEATLGRAIRLYERASQQVVINKLVEVAKGTKGLGRWVERVPTKVVNTRLSFDEIRPQLEAAMEAQGVDDVGGLLDQVDPMTAMVIWRPDLMKLHGASIVRVTQKGQPVFYQVHPELERALGGLETLQNLGLVTRVAREFTGALKLGETRLNPSFILSNTLRDIQTFFMQGEKGLKGAFDPARFAAAYVMSEINSAAGGEGGNPVVELFQRMGGELSTYTGLDRARRRAGVKRALRGRPTRVESAVNISGVSEVGPRIAEFAAILQREGWLERVEAGEAPPLPVLVKAINAAHDVTVDFRRMGTWGRYLNYYIPFFNARLEGFDKFARTWKDHPARSTLRAGMTILPLAMMYWWYRHDDDDYKERPEWQDSFFVLKDSDGNPVYRIPKSQEWGLLESGVERMLDAMHDKDPAAVERWFGQAVETANPGAFPAGVTPFFEAMFNYDSFRERPIVSDTLQKLEGPDQYYEYTTKVSKGVSRLLHDISGGKVSLSPAKIDHLANGLSGGLYGNISAPLDRTIEGKDWEPNDIPGLKGVTLRKDYTKSVDDFYARKEAVDKRYESGRKHGEKQTPEEAEERRRLDYVQQLMTDIRKASADLPRGDRRKAALALTGLARAALGREPLERYHNPLAEHEGLPVAVQAVVRKHVARKAVTASMGLRSERARHAAEYLRVMGVRERDASNAVFTRLRAQGVSSSTASERSRKLLQVF